MYQDFCCVWKFLVKYNRKEYSTFIESYKCFHNAEIRNACLVYQRKSEKLYTRRFNFYLVCILSGALLVYNPIRFSKINIIQLKFFDKHMPIKFLLYVIFFFFIVIDLLSTLYYNLIFTCIQYVLLYSVCFHVFLNIIYA